MNKQTEQFPLDTENHCSQSDLNDSKESCIRIIDLLATAKYQWDSRKSKWVDVSAFSKEKLQKYKEQGWESWVPEEDTKN